MAGEMATAGGAVDSGVVLIYGISRQICYFRFSHDTLKISGLEHRHPQVPLICGCESVGANSARLLFV